MNFGKTIIGKILDITFRLLLCTDINMGHDTVHFYCGDHDCYGQIFIYSILCLLIIMGIFVYMFAK